MAEKKHPRPQFRQLREYLAKLPEGRAITKSDFCDVLEISTHSLESIEQGRIHKDSSIATHKIMSNLVTYLVEGNLLQPDQQEAFIADLTERRSVIGYLPPLETVNVPRVQQPVLLKSVSDLHEQLRHYIRPVYVGYQRERERILSFLNENFQRVLLYG